MLPTVRPKCFHNFQDRQSEYSNQVTQTLQSYRRTRRNLAQGSLTMVDTGQGVAADTNITATMHNNYSNETIQPPHMRQPSAGQASRRSIHPEGACQRLSQGGGRNGRGQGQWDKWEWRRGGQGWGRSITNDKAKSDEHTHSILSLPLPP